MKEAIILAGGLGTRLAHVVTDVQKVMAPVSGIPFIQYVFDELLKYGFDTFVLAVSYKEDTVRNYYGNSYKTADIIYSEEKMPLGTGGAIRQALSFCKGDSVCVINGDTFFDTDLNALSDFHRKKNADITITVKQMTDFSRYGTVSFATDGRINAFYEKKKTEIGYINGGIYCIRKNLLDSMPERFSFEKEILEPLTYNTFAFESKGYFIDIGIPSDYFAAQTEIPLLLGRNVFKAAFLDRDGTVNIEKNYVHSPDEFEFIPGAVKAIEKLRENGYLIIIISNQAGIAKGLYTEEDVLRLQDYIREQIRDVAFIDGFYYCPYHTEATVEKYRLDSPDRKPGTGMIKKAVADFREKGINIDLASSVFIGDTETDVMTGINAGTGLNVLVKTGHTADVLNTKADFVAENLSEAAKKVIENSKQKDI